MRLEEWYHITGRGSMGAPGAGAPPLFQLHLPTVPIRDKINEFTRRAASLCL